MSGIGKPLPTHLLTYSLTHLLTTMRDREILIGVTGGIAAYKTAALVSQLVQGGAKVTVVMTEAAQRFVGPATFAALTGRPSGQAHNVTLETLEQRLVPAWHTR